MSDWTTGVIAANGLETFYHRTGEKSGKPTLLLLHGYTDNGLCWTPVARHLEANYDVIMPDARGHGRTKGPVNDMHVDLLAADAAALIRQLNLGKPILFGHSMGGMQALAAAAHYPDLVKAAILEDPPFMDAETFTPTEHEQRLLEEDARQSAAFQNLPLEQRIAQGRADNPGWSEDEILPWAESKGEYDPAIVPHRVGFRSYPWRDTIARVECPLLLLAPDTAKGGFVTPELAMEAARLCPHCAIGAIGDAGHSIHRDQFDDAMFIVSEFLRNAVA